MLRTLNLTKVNLRSDSLIQERHRVSENNQILKYKA